MTPNEDSIVETLFKKAEGHMQRGELAAAVEVYQEITEKAPDESDAWAGLGSALAATSQHEGALGALDKAVELDPSHPSASMTKALVLRSLGRGGEVTDDMVSNFDPIQQMVLLMSERKFEETLVLSEEAIKEDPANQQLLQIHASAQFECGQKEGALETFTKCLELDSNLAQIWHLKGRTEFELKKIDEGIASLDKAIAIEPRVPDFHVTRANAHAVMGKFEEALVSLDQAIELVPDNTQLTQHREHWVAQMKQAQGGLEGESTNQAEGMKVEPNQKEMIMQQAGQLMGQQKFKESLSLFEKVIELDDEFIHGWIGKGTALCHCGEHEAALEAFDHALELDSTQQAAWFNIAGNFSAPQMPPMMRSRARGAFVHLVDLWMQKPEVNPGVLLQLSQTVHAPLLMRGLLTKTPLMIGAQVWNPQLRDQMVAADTAAIFVNALRHPISGMTQIDQKTWAGVTQFYYGDPMGAAKLLTSDGTLDVMTSWYVFRAESSFGGGYEEALNRGRDAAEVAYAEEDAHAETNFYAGLVFAYDEEWDKAIACLERAKSFAPSLIKLWGVAREMEDEKKADQYLTEILEGEGVFLTPPALPYLDSGVLAWFETNPKEKPDWLAEIQHLVYADEISHEVEDLWEVFEAGEYSQVKTWFPEGKPEFKGGRLVDYSEATKEQRKELDQVIGMAVCNPIEQQLAPYIEQHGLKEPANETKEMRLGALIEQETKDGNLENVGNALENLAVLDIQREAIEPKQAISLWCYLHYCVATKQGPERLTNVPMTGNMTGLALLMFTNHPQLEEIAAFFKSGKVKPVIDALLAKLEENKEDPLITYAAFKELFDPLAW